MTLVVMICFARSGGTLLNRCLGSLPHVVILSEVNPLGGGWGREGPDSYVTPQQQAAHWYDIDLKSDGFTESIVELHEVCENRGLHLIVRDWSFVNFVPHIHNNWNPPGRLLTLATLKGELDFLPFAFVRDSIDVWISRGTPPAAEFFDQYLGYVKEIVDGGMPIFKYENLCAGADTVIRGICEYAGLPYSDSYKDFASFDTVNGDVQGGGASRGGRQYKIKRLPRRALPKELIGQANLDANMPAANTLLGYPTSYYGAARQSGWLRRTVAKLNTIRVRLLGPWT